MEENKSRLTKELEETQERLQAMRDKANKYRQLKRDNALLSLQIERPHRDNKNYQQRLQEAGLQEKDRFGHSCRNGSKLTLQRSAREWSITARAIGAEWFIEIILFYSAASPHPTT